MLLIECQSYHRRNRVVFLVNVLVNAYVFEGVLCIRSFVLCSELIELHSGLIVDKNVLDGCRIQMSKQKHERSMLWSMTKLLSLQEKEMVLVVTRTKPQTSFRRVYPNPIAKRPNHPKPAVKNKNGFIAHDGLGDTANGFILDNRYLISSNKTALQHLKDWFKLSTHDVHSNGSGQVL